MTVSQDERYMRAALRLARLAAPFPNPPVGAVVVLDGNVVGIGHHERAGAAHGELAALLAAGTRANGADLYVSLEPCNHFGRTPPCVDAILKAGVKRVVIGCLDPNASVLGGGCARLARAGVVIAFGPWHHEAEVLIASWRSSLRAS